MQLREKENGILPAQVHPSACIDEGVVLGNEVRIWHFSHLMAGCIIGDRCNIGQNVVIASGVVLGKNVKIQNNVSVYEGVECEDDVFLGPSMVFTNVINPRSFISRKQEYRKTKVCRGASIGANATILCGIEIGAYALIGAGAVVTRSVPPHALVIGNPAKQTGWVSHNGHKLNFDADGRATCPESLQRYVLTENQELNDITL